MQHSLMTLYNYYGLGNSQPPQATVHSHKQDHCSCPHCQIAAHDLQKAAILSWPLKSQVPKMGSQQVFETKQLQKASKPLRAGLHVSSTKVGSTNIAPHRETAPTARKFPGLSLKIIPQQFA